MPCRKYEPALSTGQHQQPHPIRKFGRATAFLEPLQLAPIGSRDDSITATGYSYPWRKLQAARGSAHPVHPYEQAVSGTHFQRRQNNMQNRLRDSPHASNQDV